MMYYDYIMIQIQKLSPDDKTVRTQITLTQSIKKAVEDIASDRGESLSEFLRKAALISIMLEKDKKESLSNLAKRVVGSLKNSSNPNWKDKESIYKWSRQIREEW